MFKLIKRLFRWALCLLLIAVALAVAAVLLLDTVAQQVVQSRLRSETGMDVKIGKMQIGLSTPTIAIEDLKIYNTPEFGGSLFLNIPEIYVDYDPDAIRARRLHLNLVRINLAEINVVQDKNGRLNIQGLKEKISAAASSHSSALSLAGTLRLNWYPMYFGINEPSPVFISTNLGTLNVTLQKLRKWNMDSPARVEEISFGITNEVFTNLQTQEDFRKMVVLLSVRRSDSAAPAGNAPIDLQQLLQQFFQPETKK
jgi:hypothetical protein